LLLREVEKRTGIVVQFAACFTDHRDPERIEHTVRELVAQRVYGLALGYEDLNDHEELRRDPLLAVLVEKGEPEGKEGVRPGDGGQTLAGKSTLNRLELTGAEVREGERYKKIGLDFEAVDRMLVEVFRQAHRQPPKQIILDLDSTDDPLHGNQEGRFFHGYYGHYCYLPLYIFSGEHLLGARLRTSNIDGAAGSVEELERIFKEFSYQTHESWSRARRVVAKAEHLEKGANPRFVVTSLQNTEWAAPALYEELYCARGEMENRIKEQLMLFSDRTSTAYLRSNQIRLYFSSVAYLLMQALRRLGLQGTELAKAQCTTLRLKLLKIGALIRMTVRKVWVSLAGGYPYQYLFRQVYTQLQTVPLRC
jgi:hypothetical protein